MKFKAHFKLEFDIKTNSDNMIDILQIISDTVRNQLNSNIKEMTEIEVVPTIKKIEI